MLLLIAAMTLSGAYCVKPSARAPTQGDGAPALWQLLGRNATVQTPPTISYTLSDAEQYHQEHGAMLGWNARNVRHIAPQGFERFQALPKGLWQTLPGRLGRVWELNVKSPGATSQILVFSHLRLPEGSELAVFSPETPHSTACQVDCFWVAAAEARPQLTVPAITGDTLRLQLYMPNPKMGTGPEKEDVWHEPAEATTDDDASKASVAEDRAGTWQEAESLALEGQRGGAGGHARRPAGDVAARKAWGGKEDAGQPRGKAVGQAGQAPERHEEGEGEMEEDCDESVTDEDGGGPRGFQAEEDSAVLLVGMLLQGLPHSLPKAAALAAEARKRRRRQLLQEPQKVVSAHSAIAPASSRPSLAAALGAPSGGPLSPNSTFVAGTNFDLEALQQRSDDISQCTISADCDPTYSTIARAVVDIYAIHLELGSMALCTGTLVTGPFDRMFLLTADHCFVGKDNPSSFEYWLLIFDYTQPCEGGPKAPIRKIIQGVSLLYYDSRADLLLLDVSEYIPDHFQAFKMGYDGSDSYVPTEAVAIHHPNGDTRHISYVNSTNGGSISSNFVAARFPAGEVQPTSATHLQVKWSSGVTEGGSSGSPLIDVATQRVVGVLTGGFSSCKNPKAADYYGRLSRGWVNGLEHYLSNKPPDTFVTNQVATYLEDIANGVVTVRVTSGAEMAKHGPCLGVYPGVLTFSPAVTQGSFNYYLTDQPAVNETISMQVSINGNMPGNLFGDVSRYLRVSRTNDTFSHDTFRRVRHSITITIEAANKTERFPPGSLARFQLIFRLTSDRDPNYLRVNTLKGILQEKQGDYREYPALKCASTPCNYTSNDPRVGASQLAIINVKAARTITAGLSCCLQPGMLPGVTLSVYENRILSWTLSSDPFGDPNCLHILGIPITAGTDYHMVVSDADSLQAVMPMSVITFFTGCDKEEGQDPTGASLLVPGPLAGPVAPRSVTKGHNVTLPRTFGLSQQPNASAADPLLRDAAKSLSYWNNTAAAAPGQSIPSAAAEALTLGSAQDPGNATALVLSALERSAPTPLAAPAPALPLGGVSGSAVGQDGMATATSIPVAAARGINTASIATPASGGGGSQAVQSFSIATLGGIAYPQEP